MRAWHTKTRNENGDYYRRGDWSVELPETHKRKNNFTVISPPAECMRENDPVPCDWINGEWVIDQDAKAEVDLLRVAQLSNELDQWRLMEQLTWAVDRIDPGAWGNKRDAVIAVLQRAAKRRAHLEAKIARKLEG